MRQRFRTLAVSALAALIAIPALAQSPCAPRDTLVATLADSYGESLQGVGLQPNSTLVEVYVSEESGTWTIIVTRPDGMACMIALGSMWTSEPPRPKGEGL